MNEELENCRPSTMKPQLKGPFPDVWVPAITLSWKAAELAAQDAFHHPLQDPSSVFSRKTCIFLGLLEPG